MEILKKKNALRRTKRFSERRIKRFNELVLKHFDITETTPPFEEIITRQTKNSQIKEQRHEIIQNKEN